MNKLRKTNYLLLFSEAGCTTIFKVKESESNQRFPIFATRTWGSNILQFDPHLFVCVCVCFFALYTGMVNFRLCSCGSVSVRPSVPPAPCRHLLRYCCIPWVPPVAPEKLNHCSVKSLVGATARRSAEECRWLNISDQTGRRSETPWDLQVVCFHNVGCDLLPVVSMRSNDCGDSR